MACTDWMLSHPGRALTIYDIAALSGQAYYKALIPANFTSGFSKTGIYPVNREVFTYDLLLPSVPTDREADPVRDMPGEGPGEEANDERMEPTVAVTPGHAAGPQPSTETETSTPKGPENIRPYPKAAPRNEKTRRGKARENTILTDIPEKELAALEAEGKKKKKLKLN